ncbi:MULTISPECIES: LacI family DNA-binding transcriptional regulator [unclassified Spirosoma]|uniref:LacI family DNA-binding transcriptional regulator n=1 Tax=unclassified Spirosoma TaxID=2621999 RepID=UPI000968936F|nr:MULTISPECIES: LacI family DNA-binding transcriptional regulator [unclassified Spirosoma]MBN8821010.1 LacI family DNA-binding transcriptional regulator [Spirosoma sp.]OJW76014.1 MAG: LacI family transcriptional regulator [Spirosoma sp. 48-14]
MKNTPVTIKDIARSLNISISTVSRALRGMPEIHPDTRNAVLKLAEELDYQPNQLAKNLAKSRTKTIGVIVPNLSYYYFSAMLNSIEEAALQAGYSVLVCQTNESYLREITNIQNLMRSQVEGFIISLSRDTDNYEHVERLVRKNIPLVLFDRYAESINVSKVIVDNHAAAFKATEHLIENGCRRIGFLAGPTQLVLSNQRIAGYKAALEKHDLWAGDKYVFHCDYTTESAIMQTLAMMSLPQPPDGVVIISDRMAFSAMYAMNQKGIRIPDDVAIVSFNNEPVSALFSPTLTSVNQPIQEMGTETVRLLLRELDAVDENVPKETKVMETQLMVRGSSLRK